MIGYGRKHELAAGRAVGLQGRPHKFFGKPMKKSGSKIIQQRIPILSGNGQIFIIAFLAQLLDRGHMKECDPGYRVTETDPEDATE